MCPACFAALSMIVAGAISTGGVTAMVFRRRKSLKKDGALRGGKK